VAEIAVMVIDPGGNRFAQLVDDRLPIRTLVPPLVERLGLPRELNYLLVPAGATRGLPVDQSLAQSGYGAGAQLHLVPARDSLFDTVMKRIYAEAKDYAKKKLKEFAKQRLEMLFRADPNYPDPAGLAVQLGVDNLPFASAGGAAPGPAVAAPPPDAPAPAPAPADPVATKSAATEPTTGCLVLIVIVAGIVAYANRADIKKWWDRQPFNKQNAPGLKQQQQPQQQQDPYGVFVGGGYDEVIVGRRSVSLDTPTTDLTGWGLDNRKKVRDVNPTFRMVLGPFDTADKARQAYNESKIAGTERDRPNGGATVARFRFDNKEHMIDNATRVLR
jgi:hypothetical protein